MYLIKVKHAGQVLDIFITDDPAAWHETEGKSIKAQYASAVITVMYLGSSTQPKKGK